MLVAPNIPLQGGSYLSDAWTNTVFAVFPQLFTNMPSKVPPTTPPTRGNIFMTFTTPFSPALVISRKPIFLLISMRTLPGILLMRF